VAKKSQAYLKPPSREGMRNANEIEPPEEAGALRRGGVRGQSPLITRVLRTPTWSQKKLPKREAL
ncbi:MAG: hypothetical protein IJR25_01300, partial [Bacteroidales bacterium]|nr:hypothetical protein [Bacteroidales bacterium]